MKNRIKLIFALFFIIHHTTSFCQDNLMLPFLVGDKYGVSNQEGQMILEPNANLITINNGMGLIFVRTDTGRDVYNRLGELILKDISNDAKFSLANPESKLVQVTNATTKEIYFVAPDSNFVSETYEWPSEYSVKRRGFLLEIKYDDGSYIIDAKGKKVFDEKFKFLESYGYKLHVGNERWQTDYVILNKGQLVLQNAKSSSHRHWTYDIVNYPSGAFLMRKDSVVAEFDVTNVSYCSDTLVSCTIGDSISIRNFKNKELFSVLAKDVHSPINSLVAKYYVIRKEKYGILGLDGSVLLDPIYDSIVEFGESGLSLKTNDGLLILDDNLDTINLLKGIDTPFYKDTKGDLIYVTDGKHYDLKAGVINKQGEIIMKPFTSGHVEIDNKCNLILVDTDDGFSMYNNEGTNIYNNKERIFDYTCDENILILNVKDSILEISVASGELISATKMRSVKKKKDWIEEVKCQTDLNPNTKCLKFNCGPNKGKEMILMKVDDRKIEIYNNGKMIIPKGFRFDEFSQTTSNLFSITDKENELDEEYKVGLIDYNGNWVEKPTYAEFKSIGNGEYFVFSDITNLNTKLYHACNEDETNISFDVVENQGFTNKRAIGKIKLDGPIITGKLRNKKKLKRELKKLEYKNFNQIKSDLFDRIQPEFEYSLYDESLASPLIDRVEKISRIDKKSLLVNSKDKGEELTIICDNFGAKKMTISGEMNVLTRFPEDINFTLKKGELYGVVNATGDLIVPIEYDSIVRTKKESVLFLYKEKDKYMALLNSDSSELGESKLPIKIVYLGEDDYSIKRETRNFFSVINEKDNSRVIWSDDGLYSLKSDYNFKYNRLFGNVPPAGYLYASDPKIKSRSFLVDLKTGKEFRNE